MPQYLSQAPQSRKTPKGIPFIIGNELAERFSFYGMKAILVVFMTSYLMNSQGQPDPMSPETAKVWYHSFVSIAYLTPILGALLADLFFGKFKVILGLSLFYCLGHFALAIDETRLGLLVGLALISLGAGGIKPCVSAHVGDQFGKLNGHLLPKIFAWFYFSINLGAAASMLATPLLLSWYGPGIAFGIPGILMFLATFIFWLGRYHFVHIPPQPKQVLSALNTHKYTLLKLSGLFVFVSFFWSLFDQTGSSWVLQAQQMQRHILGIEWMASQIQAFNSILLLGLIPLFYYVIYPFLDHSLKMKDLHKIGIGLVLSALSFIIIGLAQNQLDAGVSVSIAWQLAAFFLLTVGEVMISITALELAYTQAPKVLKSIIMCLYMGSVAFGNIFTASINSLIKTPALNPFLSGANYFYFFAFIVGIVSAIYFWYQSKLILKPILQDSPD